MSAKKTCGYCFGKYENWADHTVYAQSCERRREEDVGILDQSDAEIETYYRNKIVPSSFEPIRVGAGNLKDEPALRYDADKSRIDLIDPGFILRLGQHYGVGAKKYAERNWQKGMSFSRCYASAQRHMLAFWGGEDHDEETGSRHVIAAAWNMAAIDYYLSEPALAEKFDDRPKKVVDPVV